MGVFLGWVTLILPLSAQEGIGLRFASDFNYFHRAIEADLVEGWFSTGKFGPYFRSYNKNGGVEVGLNVVYKNGTGRGFPNFPLVMRDFRENQQVGITALEMDLKAGPHFWVVNPKIGYLWGYRFQTIGVKSNLSDTRNPNQWYFALPFGVSGDWYTGFGTIGGGLYYQVGITNVMRKPTGFSGVIYDGGKMRAITAEITVTFHTKEEKAEEE